jgi:sigma-B regulation protein RsbU (phosphoserine phosphatase)
MNEAFASSTPVSSGSGAIHSYTVSARFSLLVVSDRPDLTHSLPEWIDRASADVQVAPRGQWPEGNEPDAVLIDVPSEDPAALDHAMTLAARLRDTPVAVLALTGPLTRRQRIALYEAGVLACLTPDDDAEEMAAQLSSLASAKRTASVGLARLRMHARHLDEQLRLAHRLQMDFLPHRMPEVTGGRFAARLQPAAWVAGDFYDIFRLDERHIGFYVADAVGHGMPAALLTVFVKKSLQTKRIDGKQYELIPPDDALRLLNVDLLSAELQEAPFITMLYGIYNEATHECTYSRGGHPRPLLLDNKGEIRILDGDGPLLGIFPEARFEAHTERLEPGDRLIFYTDGAERVLSGRHADPERLFSIIRSAALLPVEVLLDAVLDAVRAGTGGEPLADDVTLVALECDPPPVPAKD